MNTQPVFQSNRPAPSVLIEERLSALLPYDGMPPYQLHRAMRYAVLSGGKRLRPRLLLAVASTCAADAAERELALFAACAIEFVHAASLIHDDLPVFDDASERRGLATVHKAFGEPIAVLAGDALLSRAFEVMAEAPAHLSRRALRIVRLIGRAVGSRDGIIGGQSLEEEPPATPWGAESCARYHAMKTGALFRLATEAGATAAGAASVRAWAEVGRCLGLAYQLLDDLLDVYGEPDLAGKHVRRDETLDRPNAVTLMGARTARARLARLLAETRGRVEALATDPFPVISLLDELYAGFEPITQVAE